MQGETEQSSWRCSDKASLEVLQCDVDREPRMVMRSTQPFLAPLTSPAHSANSLTLPSRFLLPLRRLTFASQPRTGAIKLAPSLTLLPLLTPASTTPLFDVYTHFNPIPARPSHSLHTKRIRNRNTASSHQGPRVHFRAHFRQAFVALLVVNIGHHARDRRSISANLRESGRI